MTEPTSYSGHLDKMRIAPGEPVEYSAILSDQRIPLNAWLGKPITLSWSGRITCCACGQNTNKSFNQGYCYRCFTKLAECDSCIMSPEKCHYHQGTCRDPQWGERVCFNDHIVYLANSSGLKVGITRMKNMPSRWLDQGAGQALPVVRTASRMLAGQIEDILRRDISDRTNWRAMLKDDAAEIDLLAERERLRELFSDELDALNQDAGPAGFNWLLHEKERSFTYPVSQYPDKVVSLNLDKTPEVCGRLMGIKGQYLILDTGVINLRKYTSYDVTLTLGEPA